uniref:Uncharacterized protein n=1 Tax=Plectus sambesii TaxID=2011161 RepID=A0A914VDR7_9BILA
MHKLEGGQETCPGAGSLLHPADRPAKYDRSLEAIWNSRICLGALAVSSASPIRRALRAPRGAQSCQKLPQCETGASPEVTSLASLLANGAVSAVVAVATHTETLFFIVARQSAATAIPRFAPAASCVVKPSSILFPGVCPGTEMLSARSSSAPKFCCVRRGEGSVGMKLVAV